MPDTTQGTSTLDPTHLCERCQQFLPRDRFERFASGRYRRVCKQCRYAARPPKTPEQQERQREALRVHKATPEYATKRLAYQRANREQENARVRRFHEAHPDANRTFVERWGAKHPERVAIVRKTKALVRAAIKNGTLTRPDACEQCGKKERPHAAHADYSKPLDVRWLCAACHNQWDKDEPKTVAYEAATGSNADA